jgi:hypothetical protein
MQKIFRFSLAFVALLFTLDCSAQKAFTNCSAAFLNDKIIVDEYTDQGKCALPAEATGTLTVCTASLSPEKSVPTGNIKFKIAIRDKATKTLTMFSNETYQQTDIQKVMARCHKGDSIVLLTMDDEYALPHNEILVK